MAEYRAQESLVGGAGLEALANTHTPTPTRRGPLLEIPANIGHNRRPVVRHDHRDRPEEDQGIPIHEDNDENKNRKENTDTTDTHPDDDGDSDDDNEDDTTSLSSYAPSSTDNQISPKTTNTTPTTKKPTKAELRAQKKAKKSAKATSKALKNQNRNLVTITSADIEKVALILHGDEHDATSDGSAHPLATDKTVEDVISRNLGFVKNIQAHKAYLFASVAKGRKEVKERKRLRKRESLGVGCGDGTIEMEGVVSAIMINLGVAPAVVAASAAGPTNVAPSFTPLRSSANGSASGRKRAGSVLSSGTPGSAGSGANGKSSNVSRASVAVAVKLRTAIKTDLEKHENEVHARYVRAGGFWRYVGKTVFERMTDFARETDVATGESWEKKLAREGKAAAGASDDGDEQGADEGQEN